MAGKGGARPGAGRPSAFAIEQKRLAGKEQLSADERAQAAALKASLKHIQQAAKTGERWAVQWIAEYELGKAASKVQTSADTDITIVQRFDRAPFTCAKCGHRNAGLKAEENDENVPLVPEGSAS